MTSSRKKHIENRGKPWKASTLAGAMLQYINIPTSISHLRCGLACPYVRRPSPRVPRGKIGKKLTDRTDRKIGKNIEKRNKQKLI